MLLIYSIAWWFALPLVLARLWWRGRKEPGYRQHLSERFGFYGRLPHPSHAIWVHAVSVGETRAAEPLVDALLIDYPDHAIVLTHMTPTGRATGKALFSKHGERLIQCYLPYDTGWMMKRFIRHFKPRACVLMETEVWPNLVAQCAKRGVLVALANARLSERSLRKAVRLAPLINDAVDSLALVCAQTEHDAARFRKLGAARVKVTGNIKFDTVPPNDIVRAGEKLRTQIGARPVLLCASTRSGEEALLLDALGSLDIPRALLLIVPRHPQRFDEVARMVALRGLSCVRRSELGDSALSIDTRVLVGDTMGEMFAYYAACDIAFIGGSLLPLGGQNLIEACMLGKPVLIGPHTFNFSVVTEDAIAAGAALRVANATDMMEQAGDLLESYEARVQMENHARAFAQRHRGATVRTIALLHRLIG